MYQLVIHGGAETNINDQTLLDAHKIFSQFYSYFKQQNNGSENLSSVICVCQALRHLELSGQCKCSGTNSQISFTDSNGVYRFIGGITTAHPSNQLIHQLLDGDESPMRFGGVVCEAEAMFDIGFSSPVLQQLRAVKTVFYPNESQTINAKQEQLIKQEPPNEFDTCGIIFSSDNYSFAVSSTQTKPGRIAPALIAALGIGCDFVTTGRSDSLAESHKSMKEIDQISCRMRLSSLGDSKQPLQLNGGEFDQICFIALRQGKLVIQSGVKFIKIAVGDSHNARVIEFVGHGDAAIDLH